MKKMFFILLLVVIGLITYFGCNSNKIPTGPTQTFTRFVSATVCVGCHVEKGGQWEATKHAVAFDDLMASGHASDSCTGCHVTGLDDNTMNGGYDDPNPAVKAEFEGVQCEQCHGAGGAHVNAQANLGRPLGAWMCGECHDGVHHPTYTEWQESKHAAALDARDLSSHFGVECLECHSADYRFADSIPEGATVWDFDFGITCVVCHDPHSTENPFQLRAEPKELCGECHNNEGAVPGQTPHHSNSEMFNGEGGYEYAGETYNNSFHTSIEEACVACHMFTAEFVSEEEPTISGHTWKPLIEACQECHPGLDTFDRDGKQSEIEDLMAELKAELDSATAEEKLTLSYVRGKFNYDYCNSEGSFGIHNYKYAKKLLEDSIDDFMPGGPPPEATFVGSSTCGTCHSGTYNSWQETGHHNMLTKVDGAAPDYPFSSVPNPPPGYSWSQISYVLGGATWKAYFLNADGFRIRGDEVAWVVDTQDWHASGTPGTFSAYTCGNCHTVGWQAFADNGGVHQDGLTGIDGTFDEAGMGCERCHGFGSNHVAAPSPSTIEKDSSSEFCGECHSDSEHILREGNIVVGGSFLEMLNHGSHGGTLGCNDCHNVHATAYFDAESMYDGVKACTTCHSGATHTVSGSMSALACTDCHMPKIMSEAILKNEGTVHEKGDMHGHIFSIDTTGIDLEGGYFTTDGTDTWITEDGEGKVKTNLAWACMQCHDGTDAFEITSYSMAASTADGIHG